MGYYDKKITAKKAISWTTAIVLIGGVIGAAANITQIMDWLNNHKSETSEPPVSSEISSLPLTIEPQTELTTIYEETVPLTEAPTLGYEYLSNLKAVESSGLWEDINSETDSLGNQHVGKVLELGSGYDENCYATYYLGGQYKTLSGSIAITDGSDQDYKAQLTILTDDNVIYSTEELSRMCVPFDFSVNVENCQWLTINKNGYAFNGHCACIILDNWKLEK